MTEMNVHLDHAATGLPRHPDAVDAAARAAHMATPGRGRHGAQAAAAHLVRAARESVRGLVGAGTVCFTAGATHALNQAIAGIRPRPRAVAVDPMAHNAVRRPLLGLGVPIWILPHDESGRVDLGAACAEWEPVDLVVVTHASNVTGLVQPAAEIIDIASKRGARTIVDAAQTAGLLPLGGLGGAAAIAFSSHKALRGLPGSGALVLGHGVDVEPLVTGGTGADAIEAAMPAELPERLEAGTPNLPGIASFGEAARAAPAARWDWERASAQLRESIARAGGRCVGAGELPVVAFELDGLSATEVEEILDRSFGITVRAGLHCSPSAHETLGTIGRGTVRASAGATTMADDVAALEAALRAIARAAKS